MAFGITIQTFTVLLRCFLRDEIRAEKTFPMFVIVMGPDGTENEAQTCAAKFMLFQCNAKGLNQQTQKTLEFCAQ